MAIIITKDTANNANNQQIFVFMFECSLWNRRCISVDPSSVQYSIYAISRFIVFPKSCLCLLLNHLYPFKCNARNLKYTSLLSLHFANCSCWKSFVQASILYMRTKKALRAHLPTKYTSTVCSFCSIACYLFAKEFTIFLWTSDPCI